MPAELNDTPMSQRSHLNPLLRHISYLEIIVESPQHVSYRVMPAVSTPPEQQSNGTLSRGPEGRAPRSARGAATARHGCAKLAKNNVRYGSFQ